MPMEQFTQHLLRSLLSLSSDPVANVRVLVAKALRQSVMEKGKIQIKDKHSPLSQTPWSFLDDFYLTVCVIWFVRSILQGARLCLL